MSIDVDATVLVVKVADDPAIGDEVYVLSVDDAVIPDEVYVPSVKDAVVPEEVYGSSVEDAAVQEASVSLARDALDTSVDVALL
ncbi:hypothetical protein NKR23_g9001 [Pleurostoma richardsiae]|uniref:Uncharacterized protein n=1 Tax=Pleurostoma richardsiae TaxID=41990 RepID=A0AA38VCH1_9PEZI|nr:hypothetical protein NKR23_g9001 [Pleurostoma richardsiae]